MARAGAVVRLPLIDRPRPSEQISGSRSVTFPQSRSGARRLRGKEHVRAQA